MKKGRSNDKDSVLDGMHGDMLILSILTGLTSIIGLPWMAAATTRSGAHVRSLSKNEDVNDIDKITGMMENRISPLGIHMLIGACAIFQFPRMLLSQVPLPILSGVLLYLGFSSLQGLELWDRIRGLFQDSTKKQYRWSIIERKPPTTTITGRKTSNDVRNFTIVQMVCVAVMMRVTKSSLGVISPFILGFLPILRTGLLRAKIFSPESMETLDGERADDTSPSSSTTITPTTTP